MVVGDIPTGTEVVVIGGGPGGYTAAIRAAQLGKEVVLVERDALGGVCLNVGCIPSKALISAASSYHKLQYEAERGILADNIRVDLDKLQDWKASVVSRLNSGVKQLCTGNGVTIVSGTATFSGPNQVVVETAEGTRSFQFENAIIATGSRPVELPAFPFDHPMVLDSTGALALRNLPEQLLVIGGGYIGLELGTVYAKLGSQVTVVEMTNQLLPGTDPELVRLLERRLRKLGIKVHLQTVAESMEVAGDKVNVLLRSQKQGEEPISVTVDKILVTVGRRPNSENLNLASAGVSVDEKGFITVDEQMRTSAPHIFAIGDVVGGPMLAHKATHEGLVAAEVIAGNAAAFEPATIPAVVFTDPEIAIAGMSEDEAKAAGYEIIVGRFPFQASGRALTTGETDGLVKIVADAESRVILGVHIIGASASELISEGILAIEMAARLEDLALTIHPHPTLSEALMEASEAAMGKAIHILNKR